MKIKPFQVVIEEDGERREVTGWRRWAIVLPVLVFVALVVALASVFVVGLALTVGVVVIIAVPVVLILAVMARLFILPRPRGA